MKHICKALVALIVLTGIVTGHAQSRSELPLYQQLTSTNENTAAAGLNKVLSQSERCSGIALFLAAGVAFREKRIEDAGFLFYIAKFRAGFDLAMFPPTATNGSSPIIAFEALSGRLDSSINPAVMTDPKAFSKALARVKAWTPVLGTTYDPGWAYAKKGDEKQARTALQTDIKKFMDGMGRFCDLLQDSQYFAAFKVMQAYNRGEGNPPPSKATYDKAVQTILRIEQAKGVQVLTPALKQ